MYFQPWWLTLELLKLPLQKFAKWNCTETGKEVTDNNLMLCFEFADQWSLAPSLTGNSERGDALWGWSTYCYPSHSPHRALLSAPTRVLNDPLYIALNGKECVWEAEMKVQWSDKSLLNSIVIKVPECVEWVKSHYVVDTLNRWYMTVYPVTLAKPDHVIWKFHQFSHLGDTCEWSHDDLCKVRSSVASVEPNNTTVSKPWRSALPHNRDSKQERKLVGCNSSTGIM